MKIAEYIMNQSERPWYTWVVFLMTICESIFLFVPPEVFMTPAIIANKKRAVPITIAATIGSIVGGAIAYMIGMYLFDSIGIWVITNVATMEQFNMAREMFINNGLLILGLAAVTPIPYKIISMCAGFVGFPTLVFLGVTAILRTGRFVIVATLLYFFQERAKSIIQKYFWPLLVLAIIAAGTGIILMTMM